MARLAAPTAIAILVACATAIPARADGGDAGPPGEVPLGDTLRGAAKEAYDAATVLVNNKDCARAVEKYRQAYDLSHEPRLLFNMAVCDRDLRDYAQMRALLLRYEREAGASIPPDRRAEVEAALAAIRAVVATIYLTVDEPGAQVQIDGQVVGTTPLAEPIVVDLGKHVLAVNKEGFDPLERSIELAGGDDAHLALTLAHHVRPAVLRIASDPASTIFVDRLEEGQGAYEGSLAPGRHTIDVTCPGKRAYASEVTLGDGEARSLQVTLEADRHAPIWPWIVGGAAVLAGAVIGGYFLLRPQDARGGGPQGQLFTVQLPAGAN
ncbi:MAG TPA: PEGA domain-containing protein [Polyangiaceae bacterium]|nr:PEGA domain-containing protein [Polyangiaceae bacterium]